MGMSALPLFPKNQAVDAIYLFYDLIISSLGIFTIALYSAQIFYVSLRQKFLKTAA